MHMMVGGDIEPGEVPSQPFFGDHHELVKDCSILNVRSPRKAHFLRDKLAKMMLSKFIIPKQYWLMATGAAYIHECIAGKQLPRAMRPMPQGQQDELKAILEKAEDQFAAHEDDVLEEASLKCEKCNTPKLD